MRTWFSINNCWLCTRNDLAVDLTTLHKLFWVALRVFWSGWRKPLVTPRTVVNWLRAGFRLYWTWISRFRRVGGHGTGRILDSRRRRPQVVQQKFALWATERFIPFRDSAGCTIAMRWQRRLKSNSSEDETLLLETRTRHGSHFLRASFAGRRINLPSKTEVLTSSGRISFLMPAQRLGEQRRKTDFRVRVVPATCQRRS